MDPKNELVDEPQPELSSMKDLLGEEEETEPPKESSPEPKDEKEEPPQEGEKPEESKDKPEDKEGKNTPTEKDVPFHKNPRWKKLVESNRELGEKVKFYESDEYLNKIAERLKPTEEVSIPAWFSAQFGSDPALWKAYDLDMKRRLADVKNEWREDQTKEAMKAKEREVKSQQWIEDQVRKVEDEYDVTLPENSSDRNEFFKFMKETGISDSNGNFDLVKGYKYFKDLKKPSESVKKKKEIAGISSSRSKAEESSKKKVNTPGSFKNVDPRDISAYLSKTFFNK